MHPQTGDVVISNTRATVDFNVSVLPHMTDETCPSRDRAMARGHDLATHLQSDLWLTEDQTHFLLVASYRTTQTQQSSS